MTKQEAQAVYAAYAELEQHADAFITAAFKLMKVCPETANRLNRLCEEINCVVVSCDNELDEVL